MHQAPLWLSADWGTTNFRLRLIDSASMKIFAEVSSSQGIAATFQQWKAGSAAADVSDEERIEYFLHFLAERTRELEIRFGAPLRGLPVILSGMAGSTIGMKTLPYQPMPCPVDGSGLEVWMPSPTDSFPYQLALVSGVCNGNDIMRGEETMLIGAASLHPPTASSGWYIFPGTHSKHLKIAAGELSELRTYMTGEIFALMAEKSILAGSVSGSAPGEEPAAFSSGLEEGWSGRLTHSLFLVRTGDILGKIGKPANYQYLSGLLIGHELLAMSGIDRLCLVGEGALRDAYRRATQQLLPDTAVTEIDAATALVRGQSIIAQKIFRWEH